MKKFTKIALSALSLASVAAISIAGTVAYLQDTESKMNVLTVGEAVDIAINEYQRPEDETATKLDEFEQGKKLYPIVGSAQAETDGSNMDGWGMTTADNYGDKIVTIENTGKADAYIRVFIAMPKAVTDLSGNGDSITSDDAVHWNYGNRVSLDKTYDHSTYSIANWGWDYSADSFIATIDGVEYCVQPFTLKNPLAPGAESTAVMSGVYLDASVDYDDGVYTMTYDGKTYNINYDFSQGVTVPVYAQAASTVEGLGDAQTAFKNWAQNVTGSVIASPESKAVRPAGYIPDPAGETIDGLVVLDNSDDVTNLRALYNGEGENPPYMTGDLIIKNSYLEGTYAMNAYAVDGSDADLIVSNTDLRGWVSYTGFASASFTSCTFAANTNPSIENTLRPYDTTVFTNCDFEDGYVFALDKLGAEDTITLVNCTIGGVAITDVSQLTIDGGSAASVIIG